MRTYSDSVTFARATTFAAGLVPLAFLAMIAGRFWNPAPVTDEWELVQWARLTAAGQSPPVVTLGEHSLVLPTLLYSVVGPWCRFDSRVFMSVQLLCLFALYVLLFMRLPRDYMNAGWPAVLLGMICFSSGHWNNILWGFQFVVALTVFFVSVSLWSLSVALDHNRPVLLPCALLLMYFATHTSGSGIIGWVAGVAILAFSRSHLRWRVVVGVVWVSVCVATMPEVAPNPGAPSMTTDIILGFPHLVGWASVSLLYATDSIAYVTAARPLLTVVGAGVLAFPAIYIIAVRRPNPFVIGLYAFGIASVGGLALARGFYAPYHSYLALPFVAAGLLIVMDALSCTTNKYAHLLGQATCMILLMLYVAGTCAVAQTLGPRHATYIDGIVTYMKRFSAERDARMPFPQPAGQQLSEEIVLYLAASRNPMFTEELALSKQALRELRQLRADRAQPLADTSVQELVRGQDGVVLVRGSAEDGDIPALLLNGRIILGIIAGMSAQLSEPRGMDMKFMTLGFTHSELPYCVRVRRLQGVALVIPAPQCV